MLIDTPGLHKPRTLLGERLNDLVRTTWAEVDIVGVCLPANERIGPGDTYLVGEIAALPKKPILVAVATKSDLVSPSRMAEHLMRIAALEDQLGVSWAHIIPVSASKMINSTCWATPWSICCPRGRRCIPTVRSPTSPRRRWSPN